MDKKEARQKAKDILQNLSKEEKQAASQNLCSLLASFLQKHSGQSIALFSSLPEEVQIHFLPPLLSQRTFLYPLTNSLGEMSFHQVQNLEEMKKGNYGIREPQASQHPLYPIGEIDIFLCPALAFLPNGKRLGRGKGFYDKALQKRKSDALLIGISYSCQIFKNFSTEPYDIPMDILFTEKGQY